MKKWWQRFEFKWWGRWVGIHFTPYDYTGANGEPARDGRYVTDWMLYVGFFCITKNRYAN